MYMYQAVPIPLLLPVHQEVQLRPWFSAAILNEGLQLIREGRISFFHALRYSVGASIESGATVTIQFEKSSKLSQGFTITSNHCGLCGHKAERQRCAHMAALAILSLIAVDDTPRAKPIPLSFSDSHWSTIGSFLHDWLGRSKYSVACTAQEDWCRWQATTVEGGIAVNLPHSWFALAEYLLPGMLKRGEVASEKDRIDGLLDQLQLLAMTPGERQLAKAGSVSVGWRRDSSFWNWLAQMLFIYHNGQLPELKRDPVTSSFVLQRGEMGEPGSFSLALPPEKTWEIVRTIPFEGNMVTILPAARECFRVFFNEENCLEVQPSLRLEDGRVLDRQPLSDNRFSNAYYLEGEGFLPTLRLPAEGVLVNPVQQPSSLSLLGFLKAEETKNTPFFVSTNDIPAFLRENSEPLHYTDNIVDPTLLDLKIVELPDRLIIESFTEHDDWCSLNCRCGLGTSTISLGEIVEARKGNLSCLPGRKWLQLDGTPLSWFYLLLDERYEADGERGLRLSYLELFRLTALVPKVEITVGDEGLKDRLTQLLDVEHWADGTLLASVPAHLRSYQSNGLAWLMRLYRFGIGGLLADDMGLGKTHQGLAMMQLIIEENPKGSILVICPASVVLHWVEKIKTYYQGLDYGVYYGNNRDLAEARRHNIIITTYGVVRQDVDQLLDISFDLALFDEIQQAKNHTTVIHQALAVLKSRVKIGLTGTPVENSLQDLRSLFQLCLPGLLGTDQQFVRQYVRPITEFGSNEVRERLSRLIHPFILRRSRGQVLHELPEMIEDDRLCKLSGDQVRLYREVLASRSGTLAQLEDDTAAIPYMHILATITRLKQVCCHPSLLDGGGEYQQYACGKWDLFVELSDELLAADIKFVVFSQYLGMLDIIEDYFSRQGIGIAGLRGNMAAGKRQEMIERFNTDPECRIFSASLLAGGIGIDLTGAQAVIHYDRWWNPAKEEQATARVHRMGQNKVVQVFRLITVDTLEEKIHQLLQEKRQLATSLIAEDEAGIIKQMDREQLAELFRVAPVLLE